MLGAGKIEVSLGVVVCRSGADVHRWSSGAPGRTALFDAAQRGHAGVLADLLRAGANTSARDADGWTPLMVPPQVVRTRSETWLSHLGAGSASVTKSAHIQRN